MKNILFILEWKTRYGLWRRPKYAKFCSEFTCKHNIWRPLSSRILFYAKANLGTYVITAHGEPEATVKFVWAKPVLTCDASVRKYKHKRSLCASEDVRDILYISSCAYIASSCLCLTSHRENIKPDARLQTFKTLLRWGST